MFGLDPQEILGGSSFTVLVGIIWWLFSKTIPNMQKVFKEALDETQEDFKDVQKRDREMFLEMMRANNEQHQQILGSLQSTFSDTVEKHMESERHLISLLAKEPLL